MANWFKDYEDEPIIPKAEIPWVYTTDFKAQSLYIKKVVSSAQRKVDSASDEELLSISQQCYNLRSWIRQMGVMGYEGLAPAVDAYLNDTFDNSNVIYELQQQSFVKWMKDKSGQYKLGENYFCIYQGHIYYRNFQGDWYNIDPQEVFLIVPILGEPADKKTCNQLEAMYQPAPYDKIYNEWQRAAYAGNVTDSMLSVQTGTTTPEANINISLQKIRAILAGPVAYSKIIEVSPGGAGYVEYMIKLSYLMAKFAQERRKTGQYTIYLLRDCIMFYELQAALDMIEDKQTSFDQLFIGRKLLSNAKREGGHWFFTQNVMYLAYMKHPDDFKAFYDEYSRILHEYIEYSEEFARHINNIAHYIDAHIQGALLKNQSITVVDLGFQGSINILVKFIIDNYCVQHQALNVDIHMYVLAEWFKDVYKSKYSTETYSLLTSIEDMSRNEHMYEYIDGSFNNGKISVKMGSVSDQKQANIELIVATMTAQIASKLGLV